MVDTGIKDGRSTFEFMDEAELKAFVDSAHAEGLKCALAGSIKFKDIEMLKRISPDIIGVRGLVCGGDRTECIKAELIARLVAMLN